MELDQTRIEDAIVREVADRIIGDDDLYSRVKRGVDARIDKHFEDTADAQIQSAIEAAVSAGFEHEYCRIDSFGKRDGKPTTIRAELERMIAEYWSTKVDRQGKPSSGYGAEQTRAEWMMTQLVAADFGKEMKQHVVNLGGTLKDRLRLELHETVNKLLAEVFHVRSAYDQDTKRTDRSVLDPLPKAPAPCT
jgi:hypothetical protein